ncbi:purine and uridine phosphorylase [Glonium stellatum]|uniref:Purine and uridine phosphorylase n=1 Tax=Glonium stellatum TaxID=574774 RepID=A0A8E2EZP3_9PEZI|nr:purine and uridine phosphorylase [Glonium stellatum]
MKRPRPQAEDFTVGWISALHVELTAAREMLDEEYEGSDDTTQYTLGRIGNHNVVISCLPAGQLGTNSAAAVATEMRLKFPALQIGLMVGIGGGVPSPGADIRLGDVVISQPQGNYGGVVQYDFGKATSGGLCTRTGFLNAPPAVLLTAVSKLRSNISAGRSSIQDYLASVAPLEFDRRNAGPDTLFRSSYDHIGGETCDRCHKDMIVTRVSRHSEDIVIHYGTVASGNQVMRDGSTRDKLSGELGGVLCFEMEAAGLMNSFPCLVIRGICDYADSHKNKKWQPFAAAAAAACAKEILSIVPACCRSNNSSAEASQPIATSYTEPSQSNGLNDARYRRSTGAFNQGMEATENVSALSMRPILTAAQRESYLHSLRFDQIDARHATIRTAHAKTCRWLLTQSEYQDWLDPNKLSDHHGFLWIKGKPATGKSTIMKFACADAKKGKADTFIMSFFFNARGEEIEKSSLGMYRSLLFQLLSQLPDLQDVFDFARPSVSNNSDFYVWDIETTKNIFEHAIKGIGQRRVTCFIDALDECDEDQVREMVSFFEQLGQLAVSSQSRFHVCFSSRHYPHITIDKSIQLILEGQEGHQQDIANYLHSELKIGRSRLAEEIKAGVLERASGIFLWVVLVVQMLRKEYDRGRLHGLKKRLDEIPNGLHELFKDILTRDGQNIEELILCLQCILYSKRPLKREELYFAVLAGAEPEALTAWNPEETTIHDMERFILSSSKGLAEMTKAKDQTVQFIHESVRDFLKEHGLDDLRSDLKSNFPGFSHDRLRQCCQNYMKNDVSTQLPLPISLPAANSEDAADLRRLASEKFPFLEYAVRNTLYHADAAHGLGILQDEFVEDFNLQRWITLDNLFERFQVRRHTPTASLLYILAEKNLPNLISIELKRRASRSD